MFGYGASLSNADYASSSRDIESFDPSLQTFCIETSEYATAAHFAIGTDAVRGSTTTGLFR